MQYINFVLNSPPDRPRSATIFIAFCEISPDENKPLNGERMTFENIYFFTHILYTYFVCVLVKI